VRTARTRFDAPGTGTTVRLPIPRPAGPPSAERISVEPVIQAQATPARPGRGVSQAQAVPAQPGSGASPAELAARQLAGTGLAVLASAAFPASHEDVLPDIVRFVVSSFSPLVAELGERCLREYFGTRPADPDAGERTGVVLASRGGDFATAAAIAAAIDEGRKVPPMLFYQSNPNAVVGYLTARWGLGGPVVCTSPPSDTLADALADALLLIHDGDAAAVLVIVAEQGRPSPPGVTGGESHDHGTALLIGPGTWPPARAVGSLAGLS